MQTRRDGDRRRRARRYWSRRKRQRNPACQSPARWGKAVRLNAAHALGTVGGSGQSTGALAETLSCEEDEWVRRYAALSMLRLARQRSMRSLNRPLSPIPTATCRQNRLRCCNAWAPRSDVCSIRNSAGAALVSAYGHRKWVHQVLPNFPPHMIQTT